jgi:hypothetical protein
VLVTKGVVKRDVAVACSRESESQPFHHRDDQTLGKPNSPGSKAPTLIAYAPRKSKSPLPSSDCADLMLPRALSTSSRRKTRSSMPGDGWHEKGMENVDLKMGLKALPLLGKERDGQPLLLSLRFGGGEHERT